MSENLEYDCLLSCIMIGKKSVGKTSIIYRMLEDDFAEQECTIGMEMSSMNTELTNGAILKINILDTGGADLYKDIILQYLDDVHVVVLVFSMNDITSLQSLTEWKDILKERGITNETHLIIVIGNKLDLLADPNLNQKIEKQKKKRKNVPPSTPPLRRRLKSRFGVDDDRNGENSKKENTNLNGTSLNNSKSLTVENSELGEIASWNALEHHNMTEKAKTFASSIGAYYLEVSALSGQNIKSFHAVLPKLAGKLFDIKPRLMKHGKRKKGESSISILKHKHGDIDDQSCQCVIS